MNKLRSILFLGAFFLSGSSLSATEQDFCKQPIGKEISFQARGEVPEQDREAVCDAIIKLRKVLGAIEQLSSQDRLILEVLIFQKLMDLLTDPLAQAWLDASITFISKELKHAQRLL